MKHRVQGVGRLWGKLMCLFFGHAHINRMMIGYHAPPERKGVWYWCPRCEREERA